MNFYFYNEDDYIKSNTKRKRGTKKVSKRGVIFSKDKGIMKQNRMIERCDKNSVSNDQRQYYCNTCKVWRDIAECPSCYVEWCGIKGDYKQCGNSQCNLCEYHIDNFHNINTHYVNYWNYRDEIEYYR